MTLYENWMEKAFSKDGKSVDQVWDEYLPLEQKIYEYVLGQKVTVLEGSIKQLAGRFNMTPEAIVAFIDGLNDALSNPFEMNTLEEDTSVKIEINFEKLYKKMVEYKAEHLYNLPEWEGIFDLETRRRLTIEQKKSRTVVHSEKIGRNEPCPCGSGKKYKKCCGAN